MVRGGAEMEDGGERRTSDRHIRELQFPTRLRPFKTNKCPSAAARNKKTSRIKLV